MGMTLQYFHTIPTYCAILPTMHTTKLTTCTLPYSCPHPLNEHGALHHRRLQSCVGTWARLGYAAFDAQLRKRVALHCTLYTVVCTCVTMLMLVWGHAARLRIRSLWYEYAMLRNNPGNARACPGLQAHMLCTAHSTAFHIKGNSYLPCPATIWFHNLASFPGHSWPDFAPVEKNRHHSLCMQDRPSTLGEGKGGDWVTIWPLAHAQGVGDYTIKMLGKNKLMLWRVSHLKCPRGGVFRLPWGQIPTFAPPRVPRATHWFSRITKTKYSWQNGTRCKDGVKVLHLVWLVFEGSIPTCTCFQSGNFLWLWNDSWLCIPPCVPPVVPWLPPLQNEWRWLFGFALHNTLHPGHPQ